MLMLPRIAFVVLLVVVAAVIVGTSLALPDRVATHFGSEGLANGFMSRNGYIAFMLAFAVLLPLVVVAVTGLLPGLAKTNRNIPNYDYWFAPARRAESSARLLSHACVLGCMVLLFMGALQVLLLEANAAVPPRLPELAFYIVLAVFLIGITVWIIQSRRMFALRR